MITFPFGYAGTLYTWNALMLKRTVALLDPEFRRRVKALMHAAADAGVSLGIGTGWRVQPNPPPPGFAQPGNSNHESFPAGSGTGTAVAADMVPAENWDWMESRLGPFGLRSFRAVNGEPWHIQPIEIPASRRWRTEPWNLARALLPGDVTLPTAPEDDMAQRYFTRANSSIRLADGTPAEVLMLDGSAVVPVDGHVFYDAVCPLVYAGVNHDDVLRGLPSITW